MHNAFGHAPHQFWLGTFERVFGRGSVATSNRFFYFAQEGADARTARFVDIETAGILAGAFLSLW